MSADGGPATDGLERRLAQLSPAKRAFVERQLERARGERRNDAIPHRPGNPPAPLSFSQELLWQVERGEPGRSTYNVPRAVRITGALDRARLGRALDALAALHPTLRTTFGQSGGGAVQTVGPVRPVVVRSIDLRAVDAAERETELLRLLREAAREPFDLARDLLLRATLIRCGKEDHALLLVWHHVASDEASASILFRDLARHYAAALPSAPGEPAHASLTYADFAAWQRATWSGPRLDALLEHWAERLRDAAPVVALPVDRPRPALPSSDGARHGIVLPPPLAQSVKQLGRSHGTTPFVTLLAAFQTLLYRYSRQDDIVVGAVFSGRGRADLDGILGYFSNVLPLRARLAGDPSFAQVLARARDAYLDAAEHAQLPFDALAAELVQRGLVERLPSFNVMFTVAADGPPVPDLAGLTLAPIAIDRAIAKVDLTVAAAFADDGLRLTAEYRTQLFDASTIDRMLRSFGALLEEIVARPDESIAHLALLTAEQRRELVADAHAAPVPYPREATLHELIALQTSRTPAAIALSCEGPGGTQLELTYAELDARAAMLAAYLRRLGIGPGVGVGVCADRSAEALVGLLGVLKAGGHYVPLDPEYPLDRLAFMLSDARVPVLLTLERLGAVAGALGGIGGVTTVRLDADWPAIAAAANGGSPPRAATAEDLAYVIYTSGSTGRPKGVMITHRSLVNFLSSMAREPGLSACDTLLAVTTFSFDIAGLEMWLPLIVGARLALAPRAATIDGRRLSALLASSGATMLQATPATWRLLLAAGWSGDERLTMLCGGEALPPDLAESLLPRGRALWNMYGPTETTIWSSVQQVKAGERIALGAPIANTQLYVLEPSGEPAPLGVPGELWIGGHGVARGYLGREDLTAERFVRDRFRADAEPDARMYRTGDLVCRRADGRLEYLGRLDHQVKLRGFRVELGEIEAALAACPGISAAVAAIREDVAGEPRLVAYVVGDAIPDGEALRAALRTTLPVFMLPTAFVPLDALPLTANGKVDRKALPVPAADVRTRPAVPARTPVEAALLRLFGSVLRCDVTSVEDDFFDLGGHSLLAMRLLDRLSVEFGAQLTLRAFFDAPTVAALAIELDGGSVRAAAAGGVAHRAGTEAAPLSAAQEALWLLQRGGTNRGAYNLRSARLIRGRLDVEALRRALDAVVARHGALRTRFSTCDGTVLQTIGEARPIELEVADLSALPSVERDAQVERRLQEFGTRDFDLAGGSPMRALLLRTGELEHVLLLVVHHIVSDGSSIDVIWRDLSRFYAPGNGAAAPPVEPTAVDFADFVVWQRERLSGERLAALTAYWRAELAGATRTPALPADRPRSPLPSFEGGHVVASFPAALLAEVRSLAQRERTTVFTVLLAAYATLLHRYTAQDDVVVGSPVEGRETAEVDGVVGYFVNTLPLRARFADDPPFAQVVRELRETCLNAFEHQAMPVDLLQTALQDGGGGPLFGTLFTFNGRRDVPSVGPLSATPLAFETGTAKFDLAVSMSEHDDALRVSFEYRTASFDAQTVRRFAAHLRGLIEAALADPTCRVSALPLIGPDERRALVEAWNAPAPPLRPDTTLPALFERQVAARPDALAVSFGDEQLTYAELDRRANRLAHRLRRLGVGADVLVGLCFERSLELVVAILAVSKAGGAYVPFDPASPAERLQFMLEDAQPLVLITTSDVAPLVPPAGAKVVLVDDGASAAEPETSPASDVGPDDLAYVIYTSGSTGRPKGVMVTHRNVSRLLSATEPQFGFDEHDVWTLFHSYAFDFSVWELWGALAYGGRLVVVPYLVSRSPHAFRALLQSEGVTVLNQTPSAFRELMWVDASASDRLASLRVVIFGGEMLEPSRLAPWFERYGDVRPQLVNMYGITETTVHVTYRPLGVSDVESAVRSPIGRAISDLQLYVFDTAQRPVPAPVPGELYVGGAGVARGYLHRRELTAQRFVADPHDLSGVRRLYRTGDRVRLLAGGELEYMERADLQVKLRGFRVELGEIEVALTRHPAVRDAVAVVREDAAGEPSLIAYYVPASEESSADGDREARLRAALAASLPEYMIPARLVPLAALPLNNNGKIDRKALPSPDDVRRGERTITPPRTPLEAEVASLFAQILHLDAVGVDEDFFVLGGHSLLAIRLLAAIDERFATTLSLATIFESRSVATIAAAVESRLAQNAAEAADVSAEVLAELNALSDDEALRMLHADLEGSGT